MMDDGFSPFGIFTGFLIYQQRPILFAEEKSGCNGVYPDA
jgi:hypothetical protein